MHDTCRGLRRPRRGDVSCQNGRGRSNERSWRNSCRASRWTRCRGDARGFSATTPVPSRERE
eukprot:10789177-Lingulodinium_polyedra.AAC.1